MAGIDMLHIPYRGGGPALTDLLGGHFAMSVTSTYSCNIMLVAVFMDCASCRKRWRHGAATMVFSRLMECGAEPNKRS
jgi:hypothetical protein